jgi:thiamine pyrophosphate-dependent acetolactate synthase large subunit-like protein
VRVAEALARALRAGGVDTVFGLLGSGNLVVANALRDAGARIVLARHEGNALAMADGYGRASGRLAAVSVHQGPGFTNTLTALTEAAKAGTPLVLVAADTPPGTLWSNFKVDQGALATACGAGVEAVRAPATAAEDALRAVRRARLERRPVVLSVPVDLPLADAPDEPPPLPLAAPASPAPAPDAVAELADLLAEAERPLLLAGRGAVVSPGAREAVDALGARVGAPLATSALAHGLFAGLPFDLRIAGGFASPLLVEIAAASDAVVAFGASLNRWTVRHGALLQAAARVAVVDVDPAAPGRLHRCDVAVVGDAALTARAVEAELARRGVAAAGRRRPEDAAAIAARRWRDEPYADASGADGIDPRTLTIRLDDLLPAERTVVVDSGHFEGWPSMYLDVPDERGFVFANAFQAVGLGLGAAIGAAVARPDRLTVAALGDGGALMASADLETLARERLPLLVVVYDDRAYGAEVHHFGPLGEAIDLTRFADADLAALARAAGAEGLTVRSVADLDGVADWLARRDGPLVVDAKIDPELCADWLEEAFRAH